MLSGYWCSFACKVNPICGFGSRIKTSVIRSLKYSHKLLSPERLNFVRWRLIRTCGLQYGPCFVSPFQRLEFLGGFWTFFFLALITFVNWDDIFFYIFRVVLTLPVVRERATKCGTNLTGFCEHWLHKIRDFIDLTVQQVHFVLLTSLCSKYILLYLTSGLNSIRCFVWLWSLF